MAPSLGAGLPLLLLGALVLILPIVAMLDDLHVSALVCICPRSPVDGLTADDAIHLRDGGQELAEEAKGSLSIPAINLHVEPAPPRVDPTRSRSCSFM
jgi:hypothetical protein